MKLKELLHSGEVLSYGEGLDMEAEIHPTATATDEADAVLFVYERIGGGLNVTPEEIKEPPIAIACEAEIGEAFREYQVITVKNARRAFATACYIEYCGSLDGLRLVGVTGTNGKTTVATLIYEVMRNEGHSVGLFATGRILFDGEVLTDKNYSMTTPDPEQLYKALGYMKMRGAEYVIMEASSHALSLGKLAPLHFALSVMTNLSPEHMDYHKNMWDYLSAKELLFKKSDATVFNVDDYYARVAYSRAECERISVGAVEVGDVNLRDVELMGLRGFRYIYRGESMMLRLESPLLGCHNIYNTALALCAAIRLGVRPCAAKRAIEAIESVAGRGQILHGGVSVVIDYAHTPYAMENLLKSLKSSVNSRQNIISVFGCGGNRDRTKRQKMTEIAIKYSDRVIITEDNPRDEKFESITEDMLTDIDETEKITVIPSRPDAIKTAVLSAERGDLVVLIGKGAEEYIIDSDGYREYSEVGEARAALRLRESLRI